ncbi:WD40 repeat-like protein [Phellopilus nigrolimitatus]|nr:WD40 repeat-like protein [Phellopilus nigrolimitatus]
MRLSDEGYIDDEAPFVLDHLPLQEREELVYKLLESLPRAQIARVHRRIAPCVQMDIVGTLPSELALHVFSFLKWQTLLKCALVSHKWHVLADDNSLWKGLCAQRGWVWRWPRVPHSPVPLFAGSDGEDDFDDEGMGDDEEPDSDHTLSPSHNQQVAYHHDEQHAPAVVGLPATPRINQHARGMSTRRQRQPSPEPETHTESKIRQFYFRHSAPSALASVDPPKPDYKLLHQTHVLLKNRLVHNSFRFSTLQTRGTPNAHTSIIYCLQLYTYPEDGRQVLFTGSKDKTVREWDLSTGSVERVFKGMHTESVLSLCAHGNYLASGGSDFRVCVWDIRDGSLVRSISDHLDSVLCVRFDSQHLVSCSKDRTVRIYKFRNSSDPSQPILSNGSILGTHRAAVNAISLSGSLVVSASGDKSLRVWDADTGMLLRTLEAHHARGIAAIDVAPPLVLSGSSDKHIRLFDIEKRRGWSTAPEFHDPLPGRGMGREAGGDCAICEACGSVFGQGGERRYVGPLSRRASVTVSETHHDLVRSVALGPDFVLSGSYDQSIKVWDRETGSLVADLSGRHEGRIFCVGFDCTKIVSCGEDQKICIWDLSHGIDTSFIQL